MSIIGSYLRLAPAELVRAREEPGWAREFKAEQAALERGRGPAELRFHDTGKAWAGLAHLYARHGLPTEVVHGGDVLPGDEDWGYGPPFLLPPDRVADAARQLAAVPFDVLADGLTPADLAAAEVYPTGLWSRDASALDHLAAHHADLLRYLTRTARYRHGLLLWYS
ncbi:YfbM family protein [Kitasatospora sp. NA04385]|uniref:YfbM family protein n=1 Tax=Kitasatospora sp. NA04385 TaxID=2742135 RepID=UPI0015913B31|nr:YfbM family protein [Kitasatospora sp. NA04385]QKW18809.1 YfbM family protein [Kitasatospora sp. NA04385]